MPTDDEACTRKELIDPALVKAVWNVKDLAPFGIKIPVNGYDTEPWNNVTDYFLYQSNREVVAVVEAKR